MTELEKRDNIDLKANNNNDVEGALEGHSRFLKSLIYKIQPVIFRFLQKELFADDHDKFQEWLVNQEDLMKKISDAGRKIISDLPDGGGFDKAEVADVILREILSDDALSQVFYSVKPDFSPDGFNYYEVEEVLAAERPDWQR